ncbi:winged helix-turn-helix transcriptional regulator [Bacillus sp. FJAT-49732]|uniref:Winged helix-turn-helix transcriptional regulator n=1 Tax=Lederbergia citrisecunda TaxID=2833583 RepID=A0A942TS80_9BACI|nr:metalloregulator ArsR/SmtB family transcription factor [Lederbergia citrisecunda]MBS4202373.1 winged helix-turn-helix transcriptional regulator [Lederbergia citrisecunda]
MCTGLWTVDGRKSSKKNSLPISRNKVATTHPKHDIFQAIADPNRRKLLTLLMNKEMPIAEITKSFTISRTAVNKHLHVLYDAGLVKSQKVGRETRYTFQPEPLAEIREWLAFFDQYWDKRLAALKEYVEDKE